MSLLILKFKAKEKCFLFKAGLLETGTKNQSSHQKCYLNVRRRALIIKAVFQLKLLGILNLTTLMDFLL